MANDIILYIFKYCGGKTVRCGSYFLILGFFLMLIVCVSAVSAQSNITDVLGDESSSDEKLCQKNDDADFSQDNVLAATNNEYDKVVDHRPQMDEYNRIYTPFEVNPGETFVKDIGLTHIETYEKVVPLTRTFQSTLL